ncbi:hypothetical protein [Microbispora rosea]|uniref:hypothetical protein n=1 Tax=Microbispora rosea TaxID=58117 RepID=UPI003D8AAB88
MLRNPTNAELARAIGLPAPSTREAMCSAGQAALFLARHVASVRLLVREGELTRNISRYLAVEIEQHPGIQVMPNTQVRRLAGRETLEAVVVGHNVTGERFTVEARAMFVSIGAEAGRVGRGRGRDGRAPRAWTPSAEGLSRPRREEGDWRWQK